MSSPVLEEEGVLREWAPLSKLLQQIPFRLRKGMFFEDVKFTCVDATIECIVIGTNCGSVYWYDRSSHFVQQLRLEKGTNCVTSVKVVSTVDFMVAAGDSSGVVSIFKIPKNLEGNQTFSANLTEKIERYTIDGLHKSKVISLDWSINGQKLFSGDIDGIVIFTEMDFVMNLSKAREIVNEKHPIVQLSYNQKLQVLIISSDLRCIIWRNSSSGASITQIGQRERPSLLPLGGTFASDPSDGICIYSCRGSLKLWRSDLDGNVKYTYLFKDNLKKCKNFVKLLKPLEPIDDQTKSCEFGKLFSWRDGLFVSYTKHNILVIDPAQVAVVSCLLNAKEIVSVCTTRTELFLIAGQRDLIRLGYTPDLCGSCLGGFGNMAQAESVSSIPVVNINPINGSPLSTSYSWNTYLSANMANSEPSSSEVNYGRDPVALPPIVSIHDGVPELRIEPSKYQQYTSIGQQNFDDIIYSQKRPSKHKSRRKSAEFSFAKPKSRGISLNGMTSYFNNIGKFLNGELTPTICDGQVEETVTEEILEAVVPKTILPDMRNIEVIVEDVARKEVLLDAMLESFKQEERNSSQNLALQLTSNSSNEACSNKIEGISKKKIEIKLENPDFSINGTSSTELSESLDNEGHSNKSCSTASINEIGHSNKLDSMEIQCNDLILNTQKSKESVTSTDSSQIIPCKNEENSMFEIELAYTSENISQLGSTSNFSGLPQDYSVLKYAISEPPNYFPAEISDSYFQNGWSSMTCPDTLISLSSWNNGLVFCNPQLEVYIYTGKHWKVLNYKAEYVLPSPTGKTGLKVHCSLAHYSGMWTASSDWNKVGKEVSHAAVLDDKIWFISKGELFYTEVRSGSVSNYLTQCSLAKVYLFDQGLLLISENGRIFLLEDDDWRLIRGIKNARLLALGPNKLIWAVNSKNILYITDNIKTEKPIWWQVPVGNIINNTILSICSTEDTIYLAYENIQNIFFNKSCVTGHRWIPTSIPLECIQITAGAVFEDKGCIWVLEKNNKLIALDKSFNILKEVLPPCNVVCITSAPGALWLLSDDGSVYLRKDITDSNPVGVHWRKLNLEQLQSQIEMVGISCGPDVVWACDIRGKIIMLVGSPHSIANNTFDPAWVNVDGKPLENYTFTKVYVGPDTYMVWALDNAGNIYVREAVFPTFPLGTEWVLVPDVKASHLSISSDAVYALNSDGVFKRVGISQSNYIGDAWLYLPIKLDYISASFDLGLYGISSKTRNLVSHVEREFPMSELITVEKDWALL